jgi:hypothetical protein
VSVSTTTLAPTTTSTEQRIAEVEAILTDLWFGWFDAIYRKDADALWNVVATTRYQEVGVAAMDDLVFVMEPSIDSIDVSTHQVLLDRPDCLVGFSDISVTFLDGSPTSQQVNVLWWDEDREWRFAAAWRYPGDLWQADCDEIVRETTP